MSSAPVGWDRNGRNIHETAIVHPEAEVHGSARIGPYAVVGPGVRVGEDVRVGPHAVVERDTRLEPGCRLGVGAALGGDPQDEKYGGERTHLEVGAGTTVREYATLHRGTGETGVTRVGKECFIMAYAHVAHDCRLGNGVVLANAVNMGGHVEIGERAFVGGLTAIHQFVRVGSHAFVGGGSRVSQDVPPYVTVAGNPPSAYGLNRVGLERHGFSKETVKALRKAYRTIFQSDLNVGRAVEEVEARRESPAEVRELAAFIRASRRGIVT